MPDGMVEIEKKRYGEALCSPESEYPYGTQLDFEGDLIDQLGLGGMEVGQIVHLVAVATVKSKSEHSNEEGSNRQMCLQITHLSAVGKDMKKPASSGMSMAAKVESMYGD